MSKITSSQYVAAAEMLRNHTLLSPIPYVPNGSSLAGMDCQGLAEYLLEKCGIPYSEINLKGSNAHWRNCVWSGTPESCVEKFGCVPPGAWLFIIAYDGGEVERGYTDGAGNANHMGVYLGDNLAIHASESRKCVADSVFKEKTIPNGGWNSVGFPPWIDFGLDFGDGVFNNHLDEEVDITSTPVGSQTVKIVTPDGNPVKMRNEPSRLCNLYWKIPNGTIVFVKKRVHKNGRDWVKVSYNSRNGYVMSDYVVDV